MPDKKRIVVVTGNEPAPRVVKTPQQEFEETQKLIQDLRTKVESGKGTNEDIQLYNYNAKLANEFSKKVTEINANADDYSSTVLDLIKEDFAKLGNYQEKVKVSQQSMTPMGLTPAGYTYEDPAETLRKNELAFNQGKMRFQQESLKKLSNVQNYIKTKDYKKLRETANYLIGPTEDPMTGMYSDGKLVDKFYNKQTFDRTNRKTAQYLLNLARAFEFEQIAASKNITDLNNLKNNPQGLKEIGRELYAEEIGTELYGKFKKDVHLREAIENADNLIDFKATKLAAQSLNGIAQLDYREKLAQYSRLKLYAEKTKDTRGLKEAEEEFLAAEKKVKDLETFDVDKLLKDNFKNTYFKEKKHEEDTVRRALASGPLEIPTKVGYATLSGLKATYNNLVDAWYGVGSLFYGEEGDAELAYLADVNRFDKTGYTIGLDENGNPVESSTFRWVDSKGKAHYNGYAVIESGIPIAEQMLETIYLSKGIGALGKLTGSAARGLGRLLISGDRLANIGESVLKTPLIGSQLGTAAKFASSTLSNPEVYNRINTFASVYATTYPRIYMEEYDNFKNPKDAADVAALRAMAEAFSESYIPNTPDLWQKGAGGLFGAAKRTYAQDLSAGLDNVILDIAPGTSNKLLKAFKESATAQRALGMVGDIFQEAVIEEEASLIGNYFVDKYAKSKNKDYVEQNELSLKNILNTAIESTAGMLLTAPFMGGGSKRAKQARDKEEIIASRWNIANNPELFKSLIAAQVQAKEITEEEGAKKIAKVDQYVKALETLPTKIGSIRDMKSLLEDKDAQYQFFSTHLKKQALLDYTPTEEELPAYQEELKKLDTELYKTQELANKYDNLTLADKRKIITDNFANRLKKITQQDDFSPLAVTSTLAQAQKDLKENKNRLFSTELKEYVESLQASLEPSKEKFKNFINNNNTGLTAEQRDYKVTLIALNKDFFTKEESEEMLNVMNTAATAAYLPVLFINNENDFIEALARNYVTSKTNERPLTTNGELSFYDLMQEQYIEDGLFTKFTEGLSEEDAQKKKEELKNRFWTRVVELKQNLEPGQVFPEVPTTPPVTTTGTAPAGTTPTTQATTTATPAYSEYVERFKETANEGADVAAVREEVIEKLSEEATGESLMQALPGLQSIFLGTNLNDIVSDLQQGNTASLAEFLDEMGASPKQIETLVNKFAQEKTTGTTETTETTETSTKAATDVEAQKADIERRRQEGLNTIKNWKDRVLAANNKEELQKIVKELSNRDPYSLRDTDSTVVGALTTPGVFERAKELLVKDLESIEEFFTKGNINSINNNSDAEYVDAVNKREMTKEQAMQALEEVGRKDSEVYKQLAALEEVPTATTDIEAEKQKITSSEFKELVRLAKFFLENPKEPTVVGSVVTKYPELFKEVTAIEERRNLSIKGIHGVTELKQRVTKTFWNTYGAKDGILFKQFESEEELKQDINNKYDAELDALGKAQPATTEKVEEGEVEPVTPEEAKEAAVIEESLAAQEETLQEAAANQAIENVRENYVYLGIKDTTFENQSLLGDENVAFVFAFIDRIENSINSADMRSLGYHYLMHSGREILNRLGLDIQPNDSFQEFKEQFRVNGILVLTEAQIAEVFKNPAYLDKVKFGMITNEKGEPLFFDKTGERVDEGTPIITPIGQTFEKETGKGGKTSDANFVSTIPSTGQIAPLSKFINGKVVLNSFPITVAERDNLIIHEGNRETVPVGNKTYTLYPGVIYLKTGNPNFPYRATYGAANTRESAERIYTLIEEYNKARLNPEESTLPDYFSTMAPDQFIKYLHNYAFIPRKSKKRKWGISKVMVEGKEMLIIYNNNDPNTDVSKEEAINLIANTKAASDIDFFKNNIPFRPFTVENGKVKVGREIQFKAWYSNFRLSNARIDGVPNRNIAFAKQDVKPLGQPTPVVVTSADIVASNIAEEAPVSKKTADRIESLKIVIASYTDDVIPEYEQERKGLVSQKNLTSNPDLVSKLEEKIKEYDEAIAKAKETLESAKKELATLEGVKPAETKAEEVSTKLPNDIREEFKGKLIYVTPGAGKTTLSQGMEGVVDTDVLMVEEMKKRQPDFFAKPGETTQEFILRYVKTYDHKAEINEIVLSQAKSLASQGNTVLTGTIAFIKDADVVLTMPVSNPRIQERFKDAQTANDFIAKEAAEIQKANKTAQVLDNNLEFFLTNKGSVETTPTPDNLPKRRRAGRNSGGGLIRERNKRYVNQITKAQEEAAKRWVETVGKKAFGENRYIIEQLLTDPSAWATWSEAAGMILFADASFADLYHESWHEFSQLYFTPKQREALYKTAAKIYGELSIEELEERIAEDFREFMVTGVMPESIQKYKDARTTFEKIADFLRNLFTNKKTLDTYFNNLAKGKVGKRVGKTEFTTLNSAKTLSLKNEKGELIPLSYQESKRYLDMIDEAFVEIGNRLDLELATGEIEAKRGARNGASFVNLLYNPANIQLIYEGRDSTDTDKGIYGIFQYFTALEEKAIEANDLVAMQQFATIFGESSENIYRIFDYHLLNSPLFTNEMVSEVQELEEEDLTDTNIIKDELGSKSQLELAPPLVVNIIRSIPKVDSEGKVIRNALTGAPEFGDFTENWNILKNTLSGATDYAEMLSRIEKLSEEYPQFEYLLQALPVKINLDSAQQLRNLFFNLMSLEKVEGVTGSFTKDGKFNVSSTGTLDVKRVRDAWALQFSTEKTGKFKILSSVTNNFILNPAIFTAYPEVPKTVEDVLSFLQEIGFNYSVKAQQAFIRDFNKLYPRFQYVYEKLKDVTLNGGFEIADPMLAIRQEHVNQNTGQTMKGKSYDLDSLVELESIHNLAFANDMVQVADGTNKFITTQATYQTKVIAALNDPKYKYFEDLFEDYPELDPSKNWGLQGSAYLQYLFDFTTEVFVNGKPKHKRNTINGKPVSLKVVSLNGVTAEEDYGFNAKTIDLADPEKHLGDIKTLLSPYGRVEENNRIGEKSTTRGLTLSSENFFLYNKDFYYEGKEFSIKPSIWSIIYKYLEAEAKITDKESISKNFNKNKFFEGVPQLAYFSEILSPELRTQVYEFFKTNTAEDFESSPLRNLVKNEVNTWIAEAANTSQNLLNKFESYKVEGKNNDFQISFTELQRYHALSMIHRIEQYKLFNYHPYYYKNAKDVEKRIPAFNANGTYAVLDQENLDYTENTLTMQAAFEKYAQEKGLEVSPRKGTKEDITYLVTEDTALDSQTARENKEDYGIHYNSYAETGKKVDVQDAASLITLDFFRKFYALSKGLTNEMKKELDRQTTIWTNLLEVKLNPKNTEAREALLKALNTPAHYIFSVKKLQYAGPGKTETEVVPVFHKYSNKVLLPSEMVDNEELFNIAFKLHASNADYLVFSTGTKITETVKPVPLFYNGKVDNSAQDTGVISLRYLKEQQEVEHKKDFLTIFATQFRKLLFKDLTTEQEKELFKTYKNFIKQITNHDMDTFLAKVKDKKAAVEFIVKELDKKNVSAITKDLIRIKEDTGELEYAIDSLIERTMAEGAITSSLKKSFIRQKFNGTQFVQFPVSLVRPNRKLKFYRIEEGKVASAEAMISFSKKYYSLLDLPFDKNSTIGEVKIEGNTQVVVNPYTALKRLNQKLADPAFRRKYQDSLTLAGVRIPVQGYNSMEKMEIVEFLPEESGNMILVPDELVVKSGGDFDIDKLFMYEPVLRNGVVLNYYNSYINELEKLLKRPEKKTQEELQEEADIAEMTIEEYMAKTGFTLGTAEEIKKINSRIEFLQNSIQAERRKLLQNKLLDTITKRLSQKEIFMDLIEPNNVKDLDEFAKTAPEYLLGDTNKIIKDSSGRDMWSNLINPHYQLYVYQLAQVMEMVGVAAKANTFQAAVQDAKLEIIDKDAIDLIYFDVNKDAEGNIKLWEIYDVDKNNKISQIISQFISGFVDVVKNDNILKNNVNPNTTGVALYLNMMGVRYKDINTFLKDEAIYLYSKGKSLKDIMLDTSESFFKDYAEYTQPGIFSEYKTAVNILKSIDRSTLLTNKDNTYEESLAKLAQFIILKTQQSKYLTPLIIGTDFDTQSIRNFESITRKNEDLTEVYRSNFFNREGLNKIIFESTVSSFRIPSSFLDNFTSLFPISANRGLTKFLSAAFKKLGKTWIDYDSYSRRFKNALVTSILETNMQDFQEYATYLKVDPSIKNAQDLLTEIKKEAAENGAYIPLLDSVYFVGNINSGYIAPAVYRNDNNLDVDVKKEQFKENLNWDSNKDQEVTEEFRNKVRNFFRIFAYTGIISSQLNKSHGSFLEIIPETIYTPVIDGFIKETAPDIEQGVTSNYLLKFYERFRYNNPDIYIQRDSNKVPNPSLKFYRNYDLDVPPTIVEQEYPNRVEKVKPTPAPAPVLKENPVVNQTFAKTEQDVAAEVEEREGFSSLEEELGVLEDQLDTYEQAQIQVKEFSTPLIIADQLRKITPESAEKETGGKVGKFGKQEDINASLISNKGTTVKRAAEDIADTLLNGEMYQKVEYSEVFDYIVEILLTGKAAFIEKHLPFVQEKQQVLERIAEIKQQIKEQAAQAKLKEAQKPKSPSTQLDLFSSAEIERRIEDNNRTIDPTTSDIKKVDNEIIGDVTDQSPGDSVCD